MSLKKNFCDYPGNPTQRSMLGKIKNFEINEYIQYIYIYIDFLTPAMPASVRAVKCCIKPVLDVWPVCCKTSTVQYSQVRRSNIFPGICYRISWKCTSVVTNCLQYSILCSLCPTTPIPYTEYSVRRGRDRSSLWHIHSLYNHKSQFPCKMQKEASYRVITLCFHCQLIFEMTQKYVCVCINVVLCCVNGLCNSKVFRS